MMFQALNRTGWFKALEKGGGEKASRMQVMFNRLNPRLLSWVDKTVWFLCTARNAIVVIVCLVIALLVDPELHDCSTEPDLCVFSLTGSIQSGLPALQPPPFSAPAASVANLSHAHGNHSQTEAVIPFTEMVATLGPAIVIIPLIAILESVAIAKAFGNIFHPSFTKLILMFDASAGGKPVDASQEMIALGLCNIFGSFVQSMPTTGSFSRTAVNSSSGVKTSFGGVYTGLVVILCLAFLMPYCAFIPKATLAAVIMTAVIFSVEHHVIRPMWSSKREFILLLLLLLLARTSQ